MNLGYTGKPYDVVTGMYNYGYRDYAPKAARFTTVDPVRDGTNWFAYVNNDPVNYIDLWGLEAFIYIWQQNGKTYVFIQVPITYKGEGATPEVIEEFNSAIEQYWSRQFGKYNVQTIVTSDPTLELMNTITVPVGNSTASTVLGGPTGTWPSERPGWTAAHEAGHLLGLLDMYHPDTKKAYDKWEGNIMASRDGTVDDRNIDEVLRNHRDDNTIRSGLAGQQNEPATTAINPVIKNH
jgi:RHS repeat-associated protein